MEQTMAKRVKLWLLALMKSTDAASAHDVSPGDGWTHTHKCLHTHLICKVIWNISFAVSLSVFLFFSPFCLFVGLIDRHSDWTVKRVCTLASLIFHAKINPVHVCACLRRRCDSDREHGFKDTWFLHVRDCQECKRKNVDMCTLCNFWILITTHVDLKKARRTRTTKRGRERERGWQDVLVE